MTLSKLSASDAPLTDDERKRLTASATRRPLWKLPICWLGMCAHFTNSDDTGVWGECCTCGKRVGFVRRETLRKYLDKELARRANSQ